MNELMNKNIALTDRIMYLNLKRIKLIETRYTEEDMFCDSIKQNFWKHKFNFWGIDLYFWF